jgi:pyruvate kinase
LIDSLNKNGISRASFYFYNTFEEIDKFIETIKQMKSIIKVAENDFNNEAFFLSKFYENTKSISSSVAISAVKTAYNSNVKAFFVYTSSGFTARLIASLRPKMPIIALTTNKKTYNQLSFYWGVIPLYTKKCEDATEAFNIMSVYALKKIASFGDLIVVTAGVPFGRKGSTNLMMLDSIGHVIVRGGRSFGETVKGTIKIIRSAADQEVKKYTGKILVIPRCDKSYLPFIKKAKGIILQNGKGDTSSEKQAISYTQKIKIPLVVQAENAMTLLKDGEKVVLDTQNSLVYFD